jgi:hypothetical protein
MGGRVGRDKGEEEDMDLIRRESKIGIPWATGTPGSGHVTVWYRSLFIQLGFGLFHLCHNLVRVFPHVH